MNVLEDAQDTITQTKNTVENIQSVLENKINLMNAIIEYNNNRLEVLSNKNLVKDTDKILLIDNKENGTYSSYGVGIHPKINSSINIMNFSSPNGYIYKDNATVYIDSVEKGDFKSILVENSIQNKGIAFDEFESDTIQLDVVIDQTNLLGATKTNVIEISPYLPGSFDINTIMIYTSQDYKTGDNTPTYTINQGMLSTGNTRIFLEEKLDIWKVTFNIKLTYQNEAGKYPFGLKHLYFLNANIAANSYVVASCTKDNTIKYISEDITVIDQYGERVTTCTKEGIKLYGSNTGNELSYQIATSKGLTLNAIAKNIKEFFVYVPLNTSIISIKFDNITIT